VSGPSISTEDSKQDYATPDGFLGKVVERFGPISFDLAAHSGNKKHHRYFAPEFFYEVGEAEELGLDPKAIPKNVKVKRKTKKGVVIYERSTKNDDREAYGIDAFEHSWTDLSIKFGDEHPSGRALNWLNCEFDDIDPWAKKCLEEMHAGANITLLTPASISHWYKNHVAGKADVYQLLGRLCFDGKNVYPKDCMLSHFHPGATGKIVLWEWQKDLVHNIWLPAL
jgi:hypothetical protein